MKDTVRLNFEFPRDEYPYLKMLCAQQGLSLKDFATNLLLKAIEEYEHHILGERARQRLSDLDEKENISFEEATRLADWDK
jgi:hypothetical protein